MRKETKAGHGKWQLENGRFEVFLCMLFVRLFWNNLIKKVIYIFSMQRLGSSSGLKK
jgi:hypothetical protein